MRRALVAISTVALALPACINFAAAQGMGASSAPHKPSPPAASAPSQNQSSQNQTGQNEVSLNDQQKQAIWQTLSKARAENTPADFQASVGAQVPKGMRLHHFSRAMTREVPAMHRYRYAKVPNQVIIVDPRTRKVIGTVSGT
jgi:hypothetical protein